MFELIQSGGWLMLPIIFCSVISLAIICERFWALQKQHICPKELVPQILKLAKEGELHERRINAIRTSSPLGRVLASGLSNLAHSREVMKESIEDAGRHVVLEMERFLNTLGTIAAITPLLGLLGTVIGMIKVFTAITEQGTGNAAILAGGISEALITTAAGLTVAIPTLIFYRYFQGRVDQLVCTMEQESIKMVEILHGERDIDSSEIEESVK